MHVEVLPSLYTALRRKTRKSHWCHPERIKSGKINTWRNKTKLKIINKYRLTHFLLTLLKPYFLLNFLDINRGQRPDINLQTIRSKNM